MKRCTLFYMHWIGVGFLIAIGFGLAMVALPVAIALIAAAWECREVLGVLAVLIVIVALCFAFPETVWPIVFWGFIGLMIYGHFAEKKEKQGEKAPKNLR